MSLIHRKIAMYDNIITNNALKEYPQYAQVNIRTIIGSCR
jgi:hypothetical protein